MNNIMALGRFDISPAVGDDIWTALNDFTEHRYNDDLAWPSLRCCWQVTDSGEQLFHKDLHQAVHDEIESCHRWVLLLLTKFFSPYGYLVNGVVHLSRPGRSRFITCEDNTVSVVNPTVTSQPSPSREPLLVP